MNLAELHNKLIAAARAHPPADTVPYAFEKRIMARLRGQSVPDGWAAWAGLLWRAAAPCLAIMVVVSGITLATGGLGAADTASGADLENTVYAVLTEPGE
jgi:hypothetical protein